MKLSIRSTPYFQWLVERRTGRKRKVLGRFGDERNAKQFLAGLTKGAGAHVLSSQTSKGHRARAGATPAAGSNLPTVTCLLAVFCLASVCAQAGGHSLSAGFSCTLEQRHGQRGGTVADNGFPLSSGSSPDVPRSAGPADSISVAAWIDTQRPHSTEPWLSPDSEGAQSERAVSHGGVSFSAGISPTEYYVHPSSGFSRPASGPARGDGVGYRNAQVSDTARPQPNAGGGTLFDIFTEQSPGVAPWEDTGLSTCGITYANAQQRPVAVDGKPSLESPARGQTLNGQKGGPVAPATFSQIFAFAIVTGSAIAGLLAVASCALSGRLEDPR